MTFFIRKFEETRAGRILAREALLAYPMSAQTRSPEIARLDARRGADDDAPPQAQPVRWKITEADLQRKRDEVPLTPRPRPEARVLIQGHVTSPLE